jgi:uncharacterized protein (TIGR02145 family)
MKLRLFVVCFSVFIFAVNCKRDNSDMDTNTVTDIDGNIYHTVTIGSQVWMVENLKVTRYRNGDKIGTTTPATLDISAETNPKYQWAYDGKESNVAIYGRLYTWYAVADSRDICPKGWHIPTEKEMTTLRDYLISGGFNYDGTFNGNACAKALASSSSWVLSNAQGAPGNTDYSEKRNKTGFNGLPGGCRGLNGIIFNDMGNFGAWWSATEFENSAVKMSLHNSLPVLYINIYPKNFGLSVRCLKD